MCVFGWLESPLRMCSMCCAHFMPKIQMKTKNQTWQWQILRIEINEHSMGFHILEFYRFRCSRANFCEFCVFSTVWPPFGYSFVFAWALIIWANPINQSELQCNFRRLQDKRDSKSEMNAKFQILPGKRRIKQTANHSRNESQSKPVVYMPFECKTHCELESRWWFLGGMQIHIEHTRNR